MELSSIHCIARGEWATLERSHHETETSGNGIDPLEHFARIRSLGEFGEFTGHRFQLLSPMVLFRHALNRQRVCNVEHVDAIIVRDLPVDRGIGYIAGERDAVSTDLLLISLVHIA